MTKTRTEVIAAAHRRLGLLSVDEEPSADQVDYAGEVLDALFEEIKARHSGPTISWTLAVTPDAVFLPLAYLLATEVGPHYEVPTEPRNRAMLRLTAYLNPDDREDYRDLDEDDTISTAEVAAGQRAAFY